ncbi:MAG: 3-deoxy-8-phosphooctulonate synthase [Candidatus Aminicenantes bacterium]|nr:3-deoxy-8-phosphooctulonate synthase [Candidatus Aminicenantes bacterium]
MPIVAREIKVSKEISIGGFNNLFLIGGPCVIESEEHALMLATKIKQICDKVKVPFIFKASFDKANRSSVNSYRGPGLDEGLRILKEIKQDLFIPVLSDVHETWQVEKAAEVLNIIQIPAFLCRQTDLLVEAAKTGRPLNIKKGQFLSPYDMLNVTDKVLSQGNENIILTERGTSFGYQNLVFDVRSIPIMKKLGFPVCIDASHSVQKPGAAGNASGGDAEFIPHIAAAGVSAGADGVFLEIHDKPEKARSDAPNSLNLKELTDLLEFLRRIRRAVARRGC